MKVLCLDVGDVWTGTALSDPLKIIAKPFQTYRTETLLKDLEQLFAKEKIDTVVIGYPKTMRGTESDQTKKVVAQKEIIEQTFPDKKYILFDERLSSKQARTIQGSKASTHKQQEHCIAAAIVLQTYLQTLSY